MVLVDWEKLQAFQARTRGVRRKPDGPVASSRLEPHAEELVYLRNQGYSLGMIQDFLKEECGVESSRGAINSFLKVRGIKIS